MDGGKKWQRFTNNLPTVRVDDILIHPRENDLIVATHGRSVWIADDITPLQQMTPQMREQDAVLFEIRPTVAWVNDRQRGQQVGGQKNFIGENPSRGAAVHYYLKAAGEVKLAIADGSGRTIRTITSSGKPGINRAMWNLAPDPPQGQGAGQGGFAGDGGRGGGGGGGVSAGTYIVTMTAVGKTSTKPLIILEDRWLGER